MMSNRSTTTAGAVCTFLCAIGVCHGAGHSYWGSHHGNGLKIAKHDGAKAVELVSASFVQDVAIGPSLDAIFWSEPSVDEIHRASLNGSNEQTIVSGLMALKAQTRIGSKSFCNSGDNNNRKQES